MDFVTGLPLSQGFDTIFVVVDRVTKMGHLIPCNSTAGTAEVMAIFLAHFWKLHGLSDSIVSDRGPQFASELWKQLCSCLKISPQLSTTFHPESDGQTEHVNAVMEQ